MCFKTTTLTHTRARPFVDDTTVIGLITDSDETAYREDVRALTSWCQNNNHRLNISKTKELIVDYTAGRRTRPPLHQWDYGGESQQLQVPRGSHQRGPDLNSPYQHHHKNGLQDSLQFCTIESILTGCITAWYDICTAPKRKALQRVVKTAQHITRTSCHP